MYKNRDYIMNRRIKYLKDKIGREWINRVWRRFNNWKQYFERWKKYYKSKFSDTYWNLFYILIHTIKSNYSVFII